MKRGRAGAPSTFDTVNPLIPKLSKVVDLSASDRSIIQLMCRDVRAVSARQDIISDGDRPDSVHLILEGWACRYKILRNGKSQIMALLLPGDFCDLHVSVLDHMDHAIGAITATKFAYVDRAQFTELTHLRRGLLKALWWTTLVDEGILRAWIVSLGARSARDRLAHLLCELHVRADNIRASEGNHFPMPLTQNDLGEALGLTSVHINRVVRQLTRDELIEIRHGYATILDLPKLMAIADFDPAYLHAQAIDGE